MEKSLYLQKNLFDTFRPNVCIHFNDFHFTCIFVSVWVFFHNHSRITGLQGKGEGISLTPRYHFHLLRRNSDIGQAITPESSPSAHRQQLDSNWQPLVSERKSLTTKLRALRKNQFIMQIIFETFTFNLFMLLQSKLVKMRNMLELQTIICNVLDQFSNFKCYVF